MTIDLEVTDRVALITINRPERLNAMDQAAYKDLSSAWIQVRDDSNIRSAIITGAGDRSFTTGADLKSFVATPPDLSNFWLTQKDLLLNKGLELWKPVIAAVNGLCLGGGMTLLLGTDIRVAVPEATFALSEVKRGVIPANGGTQRALAQLPHAIAMEMLLTGDSVDANIAERWGLINRVVERDQLLETAFEYAHKLAANAPLAVQATKELAYRSRDLDLATGLRLEQTFARLLKETSDAKEGPKAFAERRTPHFEGK